MKKPRTPPQLRRRRQIMSPEQFMTHANETDGGYSIPFYSRTAAVSFRNACAQIKGRDKRKKMAAALNPNEKNEDQIADALLNYIPYSIYDGLLYHIVELNNAFWLVAERQQDCPLEPMPANELRALMEKGDGVDKASALQQLRENAAEMEKDYDES